MFQLWKASSIVFLLQAVTTLVAYGITRDAMFTECVGGFAAFALLVILLIELGEREETLTFSFAALTALFAWAGMLAAMGVESAGLFVFLALFAIHPIFSAADEQKKLGAQESTLFLILAALPIGIGTVFGGAALLARKLTVTP